MPTLVWFRSDLRVSDNTALSRACAGAGDVAGVFIISPWQWRSHDWGGNKVDFVLRNAAALADALAERGITLHVLTVPRFEEAPAALLTLARQIRCDRLLFNREYEVNEQARDAAVEALLTREGVTVESFDDQTIVAPDALRTGSGHFYKVFTPFKNNWLSVVARELPVRLHTAPRKTAAAAARVAQPPASAKGLGAPERAGLDLASEQVRALFPSCDLPRDLWPAGEQEAHRRLKGFVERHIENYKTDRDFPALAGTSALSPYLAAGVISSRQCLAAAIEANGGKLLTGSVGITTWISELIWREFYRHVLVGFPRVCRYRAFKPETESITWNDNAADFEAWCEGRTGYPIVDAAMRQLRATGWMHNRLRMIAAMFLTKDLFIDWRWGERFFMQQLVDGDLASNNGGWQWSASTGTDAAPYFRIFNPASQSEKFDPRGTFIRQWCPQLKDLDDDAVHDPSRLPPLARARLDYPPPIVDHGQARQRVLAAFKSLASA